MKTDTLGTLRARIAELEAELRNSEATSEGRRKVLFEKAEELRLAWQRAESAEASVPTAWAYQQACTALGVWRQRAETAEALNVELVADKNQWFAEAAKACQRAHAAETALRKIVEIPSFSIAASFEYVQHIARVVVEQAKESTK